MKLYIDSASLSVVETLMKTRVFYGVTTNPVILREARAFLLPTRSNSPPCRVDLPG